MNILNFAMKFCINTVTAASNIVTQIFQCTLFDKPLMNHAFSQLYFFDIIPSNLFLCILKNFPKVSMGGQLGFEISEEDSPLQNSQEKTRRCSQSR
jgi:hypothetical protein